MAPLTIAIVRAIKNNLQILMSVQLALITVILMLPVLVASPVPYRLEVEIGVGISGASNPIKPMHFSDFNECFAETDNCDTNAICTNTLGNFTCSCNLGYSGDGVMCTGKWCK